MLSRAQIQTLVLSLLIGLFACNSLPAQSAKKQTAQKKRSLGIQGQKAADWEVSQWQQLPDGKKKLNVGDYKGKVLYLYFFQSWCPGCHQRGFPTLKKLHDKYKDDKQVEFVVIQTTFEGHGTNTAAKLKPTAEKYKLPIPFGQSKGSSGTPDIMKKYRSGGTPWVVVIDKQGKVQYNDFHIEVAKAEKLINGLK